ncbi:hypothetical protein SAMN02745157_0664 [Kaistia soli DSM 19436]|uniref:Uncharacterized protein n=1 Tax=Kaistia soli DSM 19436 TaxID=1122133 RepID=A0A1M4VC58_9HYPH|nr:hypothetical protein [Kaistia soli]SHE66460.1 hypothetical protein SAMN02745157_0664 [Kaistia soli DSM 19436]
MTAALSYGLITLCIAGGALLATAGPALRPGHPQALYWLGLATTAASLVLIATALIGRPA